MKIAFHSNQLGIRGTEIALYDYAYYNRELLNNESVIISDANSDLAALDKFTNEFDVFLYKDFSEVHQYIQQQNIDAIYYIKAGFNDGKLVPGVKNLVHTVFQVNQPHGDVYAFVSNWLSNTITNSSDNAVPHIIDILKHDHNLDYRDVLQIPNSATVFGYYGGSTSFNIPFAKDAVKLVAETRPDIFFLFMNTDPFVDLPNVIFLNGSADYQKKIGFINTCNACLHARNGGESFGLAVAEFSTINKPVITTTWCTEQLCDMAHIEMLGDKAILYSDYNSLVEILTNFDQYLTKQSDWNAYREYTPEIVMKKFKQVFGI